MTVIPTVCVQCGRAIWHHNSAADDVDTVRHMLTANDTSPRAIGAAKAMLEQFAALLRGICFDCHIRAVLATHRPTVEAR